MVTNMNNAPDKTDGQESVNVSAPMKVVREVYDWIEIFVITISVILLFFTFIGRIAYVDGESMENTLHDRETLAVTNLFYKPAPGDIVVFQAPDYKKDGGLVKRVIAVEGQTIDIDFENWAVYVDGEQIDEPYIKKFPTVSMSGSQLDFPLTVPEGYVFVMGDNRNNSLDSRDSRIGLVDERFIFGHVLFRITPPDKFGGVD